MYCDMDIVIMLQMVNNFCAFLCSMEKDAYVLCRVFHKNNIGPPNGQRYAPFIEEEWDDASGMVPGADHVDNRSFAHQPRVEGNGGVLCAEGRNGVVQVSSLQVFWVYIQYLLLIINFVDSSWNKFIVALHLIYLRSLNIH